MEIYRITQKEYAEDLSGNGARLFGGRWNSEGFFALYASSTRSLALLETLAHTPAKFLDIKEYQLITISIPDNTATEKIALENLLTGWDAPDTRPFTKRKGDLFLGEKKTLLLAVPSVMMPEEINYVLNPLHEAMKQVKIINRRRIFFDKRVSI
jgi:RES domain-containing protein